MDETIKELTAKIAALESKDRDVEARITAIESRQGTVPVLAAPPVSSSPTADGYIPFFVNGKRVNLLTGS